MSLKYKSNLSGGILSAILGAVVLWMIPLQIGEDLSSAQAYGITSRTVPYAMAIVMIGCGCFLIFQSLVLKKDTVKELVLKREGLAFVYILCLVLFSAGFRYSYTAATLLLGMATLGLLRCRKVSYYVIEAVTVAVLYVVFTQVLKVRLPSFF